VDGGLARRVHLGPGLNDIAHDDRPDLFGIERGTGDGGPDRGGAKLGRRDFLQGSAKRADRGSQWRDNNDRML
jgi:hypothetical protein